MSCVIVIQARTSSKRLPAKALLPVAGIPMVVLASKRAANTGIKVIVATSNEQDDDILVGVLKSYRIQYFRGSLNNTLKRLVNAVSSYDDETIFIRLTADNVFPDGTFVTEVLEDFCARSLEYLCCNGPPSGLPFGLSCEVTRVKHLREALNHNLSEFEKEHVTPFVKKKFGSTYFEKYKNLKKGNYRCTVDVYEDYLNIQRVFTDLDDPITTSALNLVHRLEGLLYQPLNPEPTQRLVIGTAQFGSSYGIANTHGQTGQTEVNEILKTGIGNGVTHIDTARTYQKSESVIGKALDNGWRERVKIISKLSPLDDLSDETSKKLIEAKVDASVFESCMHLKVNSLDILLLHRAQQREIYNGAVWKRLLKHKHNGLIHELGVSVQNPLELQNILEDEEVRFIQLPFNILDWRWSEIIDDVEKVKNSRNVIIHARSTLLQGLLTTNNVNYWKKAHVNKPEKIFYWLKFLKDKLGCKNVIELCLRYVLSQTWIDGIVVGMETMNQLHENLRVVNMGCVSLNDLRMIANSRPILNESTLDPSRWKK